MSKGVILICKYCDHHHTIRNINYYTILPKYCEKCGDRNLRKKEFDSMDAFGYDNEIRPDAYIKRGDDET